MRPTAFAGAWWAVAIALAAGCGSRADVPPDEALARLKGGGYGGSREKPTTAAEWEQLAREHYRPAHLDYFEDMDRVGGGEQPGSRKLELSADAIRGRNAWVLWTGGNEAWWDWVARTGYGTIDLLRLVDSRGREQRFSKTGLVNEPGTRQPTEEETTAAHGIRYARPVTAHADASKVHVEHRTDREGWKPADPAVYGYPSGVVGLRLFPNPDFTADAKARWEANLALYYADSDAGRAYTAHPDTVRPFRVGMSCGFCHVAPHPLHPPADPEAPTWADLSNNIGNQFLRVRSVFGNMLRPDNYLYHVFDAQLPGAVDTSGYPSDNNNNPNTINSFFGLPGRLARANANPAETISADTLSYLKDFVPHEAVSPHRVPRVLLDGSDSVGVHVALARVYLNIGTHHQQWIRVQNPLLGFREQRPFKLKDTAENSLYWHAIRIRVPYLAAFFTASTDPMRLRDAPPGEKEKHLRGTGQPWYTDPARGKEPPKDVPTKQPSDYAAGREVFARGCVACHSSVQPGDQPELEAALVGLGLPVPDGFPPAWEPGALSAGQKSSLADARRGLALTADDRARLARGDGSLPPGYAQWAKHAVHQKGFWEWTVPFIDADKKAVVGPDGKAKTTTVHNFLSIDERIPVTVTRTNSARAAATNGMHGRVWEDFASQTYRELAPVGAVRYRDPFSGAEKEYAPPGGGPGYYRVPTLISVWATAPFLHNNSLGHFNNDPSVNGRLAAYDDAIHRLLWPERRRTPSTQVYWDGGDGPAKTLPDAWFADKFAASPAGDAGPTELAARQRDADGGWVWRTTAECTVQFPGPHVPQLLGGLVGWEPGTVKLVGLVPALVFLFLAVALLLGDHLVALRERLVGRFDWLFAPARWLLAVGSFALAVASAYVVWRYWPWVAFLDEITRGSVWGFRALAAVALPVLFLSSGLLFTIHRLLPRSTARRVLPRIAGAACLLVAIGLAAGPGRFAAGRGDGVRLGPIPAGVPVNLLANIDPNAPADKLVGAVKALMEFSKRQHAVADPDAAARRADFEANVAPALMAASKCPDLVTDRGHDFEFIRRLSDDEKRELIALVKTF